jgi:hypothetical protein
MRFTLLSAIGLNHFIPELSMKRLVYSLNLNNGALT